VRIGLYVSADARAGIEVWLERFARAEAEGFATAWTGQLLGHDALVLLSLAGRATRRIELGTWVVPTPPRHPVALAQQAATAQAACGGRLVLGIGVSHRAVVAERLGLPYERPLAHLREYLAVLRPLLAGGEVDHRGELYRVRLRLDLPSAPPPPVLVGALGPRMLALAGSAADGAAIWLGGPRTLERFAIPLLRDAARAAGRPPPRIACGLPVAVVRDAAAARASAEALLERSARLPAYRRILAREGVASPADVALLGDEDAVAAHLERLAGIGVTDFAAATFPVEGDPDAPARTRTLLARLAASPGVSGPGGPPR
jgi:F420-dependent oxidoreductase-like protein